MKREKKVKIVAVAMIAALGFTGCSVSGEDLLGNDENLIIQGNVKVSEVNLNSKIAGNVVEIYIKEGQQVKAGDTLIQISSDSLVAKKAQTQALIEAANGQYEAANAAKSAAQAQYDKALNGARSEEVEQAKLSLELAQKTFERAKGLYESGACSEATYDEAKTQYEVVKQKYDMVASGAREEDKLAAKALVSQAQATAAAAKGSVLQAQGALAEVESYLNDTTIKAPSDGVITTLNVEVGQLISTGMPLATITSNQEPIIELNVKETDLGNVKIGGKVKVSFLAYEDKVYEGVVESVNKKPDFATKRATSNNGDFDVLSFGVKVTLHNLDESIYPGMSAFVDFGKKNGK